MAISDFVRMAQQIETLYRCDADSRLCAINEPGEPTAPRFFMGRTRHGNQWRVRYDLPATLVHQLDCFCEAEPIVVDWVSPPQFAAEIKSLLSTHTPLEKEYRGPAFWIPVLGRAPDNVILLTNADQARLQPYFGWLATVPLASAPGPAVATVVDGVAVALCHCARWTARAAEAGLETAEAYRGHGYGAAAVIGWAAAVRALGRQPLYSTWWENCASRRVAEKLGMVIYGEDWSLG
jgi:GNAT superfamily N-acetyltransferase